MKPATIWKIGNELAPFHPDASHVEPGYRDGWNECYGLATAELDRLRERQFSADMCLDAATEARRVLREHFGGNLAFLDDDLVRGVVKMKEEIDRLRADAERYRWLRDNAPKYPAAFESRIAVFPLHGPELDAAIDAAMKESGNGIC